MVLTRPRPRPGPAGLGARQAARSGASAAPRRLSVRVALATCVLACVLAAAGDRDDPITTLQDELGETLRQWWKEGSAAGHVGDFYDNRDRGHSGFDLKLFPQLGTWSYSETEKARKADWAAQTALWPSVTFGNSSTSAPAASGGSNPRRLYSLREGLRRLELQYRRNNLYVYPEHQDHDPGHNGMEGGGYGDLFPTNTPYLIVSQGSSGSDQPFLMAIAASLAAFRPEVKRKLVENHVLMPALQLLLRSTSGVVEGAADYLKGKAHPTAFDGGMVNATRMAEAAHAMRADKLPPLVQLAIVSEEPKVSAEATEDGPSELLSDTPGCIARVVRRREYTRRLVVTAELSRELEMRPLTYHWSVLRGDPEHVRIRPLTAGFSTVEIQVDYHSRRSIDGRSPLESNRVDIGAFANNGASWSAPAFVTFFSLDSEARTYDDGRLIDIGYGVGTAEARVADWPELLVRLAAPDPGPGTAFFKERIGPGRVAKILAAGEPLRGALAALKRAEDKQREASSAWQPADARFKAAEAARSAAEAAAKGSAPEARAALERAQAELLAAEKALGEAAAEKSRADVAQAQAREEHDKSLVPAREAAGEAFAQVLGDTQLWTAHRSRLLPLLQDAEEPRRIGVLAAREALANVGLLRDGEQDEPSFVPRFLRPGRPPAPTRFERVLLERLHAATLANLLLPGAVADSYTLNYVDPTLAPEKTGREVFHYAADGTLTGFTRYDGKGGVQQLDANGKAAAGGSSP